MATVCLACRRRLYSSLTASGNRRQYASNRRLAEDSWHAHQPLILARDNPCVLEIDGDPRLVPRDDRCSRTIGRRATPAERSFPLGTESYPDLIGGRQRDDNVHEWEPARNGALAVPAAPIAAIIDGTSNTIAMIEDTGRRAPGSGSPYPAYSKYPDPTLTPYYYKSSPGATGTAGTLDPADQAVSDSGNPNTGTPPFRTVWRWARSGRVRQRRFGLAQPCRQIHQQQ